MKLKHQGQVNITHRHRHILREFQKKIMSGLTQSGGLSQRHIQMGLEGRHVTDDSKKSESTLNGAMPSIIAYAENMMALKNGKIRYEKTVSLYDCQTAFVRYGGLSPDPDNKKVSMKPDGGIIFGILDGKEFPLLIVEDKVQGTNDTLFEQDKKRQATGNAIERLSVLLFSVQALRHFFPDKGPQSADSFYPGHDLTFNFTHEYH